MSSIINPSLQLRTSITDSIIPAETFGEEARIFDYSCLRGHQKQHVPKVWKIRSGFERKHGCKIPCSPGFCVPRQQNQLIYTEDHSCVDFCVVTILCIVVCVFFGERFSFLFLSLSFFFFFFLLLFRLSQCSAIYVHGHGVSVSATSISAVLLGIPWRGYYRVSFSVNVVSAPWGFNPGCSDVGLFRLCAPGCPTYLSPTRPPSPILPTLDSVPLRRSNQAVAE